MRRIFHYLIILFLIAVIWILLRFNSGYVLVAYDKWIIKAPLWLSTATLFLTFIALYLMIRLVRFIQSAPERIASWKQKRATDRMQSYTMEGLLLLIEGDWSKAYDSLIDGIAKNNMPVINYLAAAYASQHLHNYLKRDQLIEKARQLFPEQEIAIGVSEASMLLELHQFEAALISLRRVHAMYDKHHYTMQLMARIYATTENWRMLADMLPQLEKHKILNEVELLELQIKVHHNYLATCFSSKQLIKYWHDLPSKFQQQASLLIVYCEKLLTFGEYDLTAKLIAEYLEKNWNDRLVELYGLAKTSNPAKQFATAEKWYVDRRNNSALLLTLGIIATQLKNWLKATEYLMASLSIEETPLAYHALGYVYENTSQATKAMEAYKKGLSLK